MSKILLDKSFALEKAENQYYLGAIDEQTKNKIIKFINALPPTQPERKKGKWIPLISSSDGKYHEWCGYQCSICGERTPRLTRYNLCPNCEADMKGIQNENNRCR